MVPKQISVFSYQSFTSVETTIYNNKYRFRSEDAHIITLIGRIMETHIHILDQNLNFELSIMQLSLVKKSVEIIGMGEPTGRQISKKLCS